MSHPAANQNMEIPSGRGYKLPALMYIAFFVVLMLRFVTPTHDLNDDPSMSLVVSGYGYAMGPAEYLIYSNIMIGVLLKNIR
ncbi:hypothetical protein Pan161_33400 [Gimesia algae]|uniref:Uncharacterized protein n=1 Tax=Gimesia algae TaxID=2527971 RepID=A0A517VF84_9PLAN|nr:hypothetical protein Pan161_33400 [Gimesia algae]